MLVWYLEEKKYQYNTAMYNWSWLYTSLGLMVQGNLLWILDWELQGDQLNMAVFAGTWFCEVKQVIFPVYATVYTGQVTFYKEPEAHGYV